jgi:hypothetical protein
MSSLDPNTSPGYALSRALIEALLTLATPEELEQVRQELAEERAAGRARPLEAGVHHLSVQTDTWTPPQPSGAPSGSRR